jgi:hypothetical protein
VACLEIIEVPVIRGFLLSVSRCNTDVDLFRHGRYASSRPCLFPASGCLPTSSGRLSRAVKRLALQQVHLRRTHPCCRPHLRTWLPLPARIPRDLRLLTTQSLPGAIQAGYVLSGSAVSPHQSWEGEGGIGKHRQFFKARIGVGHRFFRHRATDCRLH